MRLPPGSLIRSFGFAFVAVALAIGFATAWLSYARIKDAVIESATQLFDRTAAVVSERVSAENARIALALGFASESPLASATTFDTRMQSIAVLRDALEASPWLIAVYAGYPNGDFLSLRRKPGGTSDFDPLPHGTAFVLQSIDRPQGVRRARYLYADAQLRIIAQRNAPKYRYDPRTRPWFQAGRDVPASTPPYVFFTNDELGITMSLSAASGCVFGVDFDLASLSAQLAALRPTPSSQAAIVQPAGDVLAYSDTAAFAHLLQRARNGRVPMLSDLGAQPLSAAFRSLNGTGALTVSTFTDPAGRAWLSQVSWVGDNFLGITVLSAPEDELLGPAVQVRNEAIVLTLALAALSFPVLLFVVGRSVAKPIERVARQLEARAPTPAECPRRIARRRCDYDAGHAALGQQPCLRALTVEGRRRRPHLVRASRRARHRTGRTAGERPGARPRDPGVWRKLRSHRCSDQLSSLRVGGRTRRAGVAGGHHRYQKGRAGVTASQRGSRRSDEDEVRFPRQHEPRDPHADERDHRHVAPRAEDRSRSASAKTTSARFKRRASICWASSTTSSTSRRSRPARWRSKRSTSICRVCWTTSHCSTSEKAASEGPRAALRGRRCGCAATSAATRCGSGRS